MALQGTLLATRDWRFWVAFLLTFCIFGTLMNLLSGSTAALNLFWATDFAGKLAILGNAFLANFGIGKNFWDFLLAFFISLLQSTLIGLVVMVWRRRERNKQKQVIATAQNASNVQDAGLAAGLAILGSGCPTCGTTLLAPVLGAFFSSSSYMLAGVISGVLTVAAVFLALFALKRIGRDAYILILSDHYHQKHQKEP